jgi:hypothetical protein
MWTIRAVAAIESAKFRGMLSNQRFVFSNRPPPRYDLQINFSVDRSMSDGIICQVCGLEAPVKRTEFHQNIGMLVMRRHASIKGNLCKNCIHSQFWSKTGTTLAVGWLGMISIVIAPIFIIMNIVHYLGAMGLDPVPPGAKRPELDAAAVNKLTPKSQDIVARLNKGEPLVAVARDMGPRAGVTPGQVVLYVRWLAQQSAQPTKTYGFPIQPVTPPPIPAIPLSPGPSDEAALPPAGA